MLAASLAALLTWIVGTGADAQQTSVTVIANGVTVPFYDVSASGTLVVTYDISTGKGAWMAANVTIDGVPGSASGTGSYVESADGSFTLTMDSIETWTGAFEQFFSREAGRSVVVRTSQAGNMRDLVGAQSESQVVYLDFNGISLDLFGLPVAVSPPLSAPIQGVYTITTPASGQDEVTTLPRTGQGDRGLAGVARPYAPVLAGGIALLLAVAAGVYRQRRQVMHAG
jgi:hypothetical protein